MCTRRLAIYINNLNIQTSLQQESKDLFSLDLLIMYQNILTQKTHTTELRPRGESRLLERKKGK